jgi:tRNA-dihydrouridine synthase 3
LNRCRFTHDIKAYLAAKTHDIHIPDLSQLSEASPFAPSPESLSSPHIEYPSLDLSSICPVFTETGECRYGFKCRFLGGHIHISDSGELSLLGDDDKKARAALTAHEVNFVSADVQRQLRSRKYPLPASDAYLKQLAGENAELDGNTKPKVVPRADSMVVAEPEQDLEMVLPQPTVEQVVEKRTGDLSFQQDTPDARVRFSEKKRLHWAGKTCKYST